jgi:glycosyltransferase involved in cell wall biosynthesis
MRTLLTQPGRDEALTVVQVVRSLGVGGVEAYVHRLARGLTGRGYRVLLLVSRNGVYDHLATDSGAELIVAPPTRDGVRQAAAQLSGQGVDLVHAHNYRAARFGGPLSRALGCAYLMSVHGPRRWWKRALFSEWSPRVLASSEADRADISGFGGLAANRVGLTFYGVDTNRFGPHVGGAAFREEIGVGDRPLIVHVSRLANRKARPAFVLLAALKRVLEEVPDAYLVVGGSGPAIDRLRTMATKVDPAGESISFVGYRTDVPEIMAAADVAVATANTALEAMAVGTQTVAFGRTGYFGIVDADNLREAQAVCFADHGALRPGTPEELSCDLVTLLGADRTAATELAVRVEREYGITPMIADIERHYRGAVDGMNGHA